MWVSAKVVHGLLFHMGKSLAWQVALRLYYFQMVGRYLSIRRLKEYWKKRLEEHRTANSKIIMAMTPPRTLPASWFTSLPLHQLERRAVFLKAWYLVGTVVKFVTREAVEYEFAGVALSILKNDDDEITATGTEGEKLRTYTTSTGLVFTTISDAAPSFEDFFPGLEKVLSSVDFTKRPYRRSIKYEGHFNWKTMVDGYQE
jgi:hypothetical protein